MRWTQSAPFVRHSPLVVCKEGRFLEKWIAPLIGINEAQKKHERSRALRRKSFYFFYRFPVKRVKIVTDSIHICHGFPEKTDGGECFSHGYVAAATRKMKLSLFFARAFHSNHRKPASPKKTSTCPGADQFESPVVEDGRRDFGQCVNKF